MGPKEMSEPQRAREISVLLEAREIVRAQPMTLTIAHLRSCADALHAAYDVLKISCTRPAATEFVAALNRTLLAIEKVHAATPPTPSGGRLTADDAQVKLAKDVMGC